MIAQFYSKFDELHEQSLTNALAKTPNRNTIKNEVKYRIPTRWTKTFHKYDIVSLDMMRESGISNERGKVNKEALINKRKQIDENREQVLADQISGNSPVNNPILQHSLSGSKAKATKERNKFVE
jgi:hypothetical protein